MSRKKQIFLVDGTALLYQSYFAFIQNPLTNSKGENTSAIFGFTNTLLKLFKEEKIENIAVLFDAAQPTFRHKAYPQYKATREKMPDDLKNQIPLVHAVLKAMGVPRSDLAGYEADDLIGTLCEMAVKAGFAVVIVGRDKDFMQLVSKEVLMLDLGRKDEPKRYIGPTEVKLKFGVPPEQVTEVLALMGDNSDNIPGVPQVGPKTATTLIKEFESVENLLKNISKIKQTNLRENIEKNKETLLLSRKLVTIDTQVPLSIKIPELRFEGFRQEGLAEIFQRLEFFSLLKSLGLTEQRGGDNEGVQYVCLQSIEEVEGLLKILKKQKRFVIDLETTDVNPLLAKIVGMSFAYRSKEAFYIPVAHHERKNIPQAVTLFKSLLEDEGIKKIGQNIKYDMLVLANAGIELKGIEFDTMVASYVINPSGRQHNLDAMCLTYFNHPKIPIESLIGSGKTQKKFSEVPIEAACRYSCEDADYTFRLMELLENKIKDQRMEKLFYELEMPLVMVLKEMEEVGMRIDEKILKNLSVNYQQQIETLTEGIYKKVGTAFNLNSPKQLAEILFGKMGIKPEKKTKTGFSTDTEVLERLAGDHKFVKKILEYRHLTKLKSTYIDALPLMIMKKTGRIHTSFNQTVAATGRLSSTNPNLQNIPVKTENGREIRKAFIPLEKSFCLLSADYSQIELRIMAHLSSDEQLLASFTNEEDVHSRTAALIFGIEQKEVSPEMRRQAKIVNFGIIYGMGNFRLSREIGIHISAAAKFIDNYFKQYPGIKRYIEKTKENAHAEGFVTTLMGRRRYLLEIHSKNMVIRENAERIAVNTPIQGSAADIIKKAMIDIHNIFNQKGLQARMILQVHDELLFEVPFKEAETVKILIREKMEGVVHLKVPLKVEVGMGENWLDAHS